MKMYAGFLIIKPINLYSQSRNIVETLQNKSLTRRLEINSILVAGACNPVALLFMSPDIAAHVSRYKSRYKSA
jgi:hypothetical protein